MFCERRHIDAARNNPVETESLLSITRTLKKNELPGYVDAGTK
jgi:hypothetical protein